MADPRSPYNGGDVEADGGSNKHLESTSTQVTTLQKALDTIQDFSKQTGLQLSTEKTNYVAISNARGRDEKVGDKIKLLVNGQQIKSQTSIKILGIVIDENGKAGSWYQQIKSQWKQALNMIKHTTGKACTKVEALYEIGGLNTIEEIAQENKISQNLRLEKTEPGRKILRALGYNNEVYQVFTKPPPPWEDEIVIDTRPTPQNQGKTQVKRRNSAARKHDTEVQSLLEDDTNVIIYTDAAKEDKCTAMAHYCANDQRRVAASLGITTSVKEAELQAIKTAVESAEQEKHKSNIYVFTDSKEAVRELKKHDSRSKTVKSIKATARQLRAEGRTIKIRWIPGHQGIHGNDEAHAAAREQLQAVPPGQGSVHPVVDEDIEDDVDPSEIKAQERLERRQRLADLRRPDEHPLPSTSYSRWERVCLRRLRTG
ncbi:uncharacterized protein LOC120848677, partial [Ixodes scapularis]|uniref:uncharacterized protein LOC120848677 n=1 Tax=Ixodes scapularis TaxID=6945 RepID=UPI001A9D869A